MNPLSTCITETIKQVLTHYGEFKNKEVSSLRISSLGNGLINQTYTITFLKSGILTQWVLQQINQTVFLFPEHITDNADKINNHLQQQKKVANYPFDIPSHVLTTAGKSLVEIEGKYWRVMEYVPNSYSIEEITNNTQAQQVANGFASFAAALSDFPAHTLHTIIPNFLNINTRIEQLNDAIVNAIDNAPTSSARLEAAHHLSELPRKHQAFIDEVNTITKSLPLRTVHHDTKINNLLFSQTTQNVAAVIDLDTCMPGYFMYDFGDMVRSCCSTISEDDSNLAKLALNVELFEILAQHYIAPLRHVMTNEERESLVIGVILLPLILGIRFLTDYLNGDQYFKTKYEQHNLDRAANQLALFTHLLAQRELIHTICMK